MFNPNTFFTEFTRDLCVTVHDDSVIISGWQFLFTELFKKVRDTYGINPTWTSCGALDPYSHFEIEGIKIYCTGWARLNC